MPWARERVAVAAGVEETCREDILDVLRCRNSVMEALRESGYEPVTIDIKRRDLLDTRNLASRILEGRFSCVFNLFEGFSDAAFLESRFARLLESIGAPFTGNRASALTMCLDKDAARKTLGMAGLPVPPGACIRAASDFPEAEGLSFPLFVKPRCEDSSVGVDGSSVVRKKGHLEKVLHEKLEEFPDGLVVEEYLPGREFNAGCMGFEPFEFLALSAIEYKPERGTSAFLGYDSKWSPDSVDYREIESTVEPDAPSECRRSIESLCRKAGTVLGCEGYFRVDFRERDGRLFILEVNPNPDINTDSGFARQCLAAGYGYVEMVARLVGLALERGGRHVQKDHAGAGKVTVP